MTLQEAWDAAIEALPKISICTCGYKHQKNINYGHEYSPNSLDGWMLQVYRYPQPSNFNTFDIVKQKHVDDRGNQWHIIAMPAVDSHHRNAITVRAPDQIRGLLRMTELLDKVVELSPHGWYIPIQIDYCRDMYNG